MNNSTMNPFGVSRLKPVEIFVFGVVYWACVAVHVSNMIAGVLGHKANLLMFVPIVTAAIAILTICAISFIRQRLEAR